MLLKRSVHTDLRPECFLKVEHQNLVELQIHIMQQKSAVSGTQGEDFCILLKESMSSVFKY